MPRRFPTATVYSALHDMRQGFEQVFSAMDRLNAAGVWKGDRFEGCRLLAERAAAWAGHQVVGTMQEEELTNWMRSERQWEGWQKMNESAGSSIAIRASSGLAQQARHHTCS